jgi:hypothetical protein
MKRLLLTALVCNSTFAAPLLLDTPIKLMEKVNFGHITSEASYLRLYCQQHLDEAITYTAHLRQSIPALEELGFKSIRVMKNMKIEGNFAFKKIPLINTATGQYTRQCQQLQENDGYVRRVNNRHMGSLYYMTDIRDLGQDFQSAKDIVGNRPFLYYSGADSWKILAKIPKGEFKNIFCRKTYAESKYEYIEQVSCVIGL